VARRRAEHAATEIRWPAIVLAIAVFLVVVLVILFLTHVI
jgi:hypothetical protein